GTGGGEEKAALRSGDRPGAAGAGAHHCPAHRRQVSRGAGHPAVAPAAPAIQETLRRGPMQVIISTRGMTTSRPDKDEITRKLSKLEPLLPAVVETRAVLSKEKHRRTAALTVVARSRSFRSQETAPALSAAVDRAVHALRRQVRETKTRRARRAVRG